MSLHENIYTLGIDKKITRPDSVTREINTNQSAYCNVLFIMPHVYEDAHCVAMMCTLSNFSGLVAKESCFRRDVLQKKPENFR